MRVVWLLGGDVSRIQQLQKYLSQQRTGQSYLVRHADKITDIPVDHLQEPGVIILVDAFHSQTMGFVGVDNLAAYKCKARCILLGEPGKEQAAVPFKHDFFVATFPSLDRVDFSFLAGVIHHGLFLDGKIEIKNFLADNSKNSVEEIANFGDFLRFEKLLRTFAAKFGVDSEGLRKLLMGLTLQHTKSADGKIAVAEKFPIYFGIDPKKLVMAVPTMSRGRDAKELRSEFMMALSSLASHSAPSGSMFPELYHSIQNTDALLFISGSSRTEEYMSDPAFLIVRIDFPSVENKNTGKGYYYMQYQVSKTSEKDEAWAKMRISPAVEKSAPGVLPRNEMKATVDSAEELKKLASVVSNVPPVKTHPASALNEKAKTSDDILAALSREVPVDPVVAETYSKFSGGDVQTLNMAIYELNQVCSALSKDVHVLMKNRREPTTDKELRAAKEKLETTIKRLSGEIQKHLKVIANKDQEIEELKERVRRLMTQKAA